MFWLQLEDVGNGLTILVTNINSHFRLASGTNIQKIKCCNRNKNGIQYQENQKVVWVKLFILLDENLEQIKNVLFI